MSPADRLIACPGCDWLHTDELLKPGQRSRCARCGDVMRTRKRHTVDRTLAASLAAIVLLSISLLLPFLSLSRAGIDSRISVFDAVTALWSNGMGWLGLVTLLGIVLLPLLRFVLLAWVLWRLRSGRRVIASMGRAFRWVLILEPWAMADIFMVGVVVSLVKIGSVATLTVGPAFWSLIALVLVSVVASVSLCKDTVWKLLKPPRD